MLIVVSLNVIPGIRNKLRPELLAACGVSFKGDWEEPQEIENDEEALAEINRKGGLAVVRTIPSKLSLSLKRIGSPFQLLGNTCYFVLLEEKQARRKTQCVS